MALTVRGFQHIPPPPSITSFSDVQIYLRRLFDGLFQVQRGKMDVVKEVTLTANAATTVVNDVRLSIQTGLIFDAKTANAAAELAAGTLYCLSVNRATEQFTLTHANNVQTDRTFNLILLG
jgi:hypothetical protein